MNPNYDLENLNVSRETKEVFGEYVRMLQEWNRSINLVSKGSIKNLWSRHILDCAQLSTFLTSKCRRWIDLGSGGGFPGIVIAVIAKEKFPKLKIFLVEVDKRKSVFLNEVCRVLDLNAVIVTDRIEYCSSFQADIISARALAPMKKLLLYFEMHSIKSTKGLFLKGKNLKKELDEVKNINKFSVNIRSSLVDSNGFVVEIQKRKH